jgi:hypothetical protein
MRRTLVRAVLLLLPISCTDPQVTPGTAVPRTTGPSTSAHCSGIGIGDENCACPTANAQQPCWPGDPSQRGRGDCHDGVQTCLPAKTGGESFDTQHWGPCQGYNIGRSCVGDCAPSATQSCKTGLSSSTDNGGITPGTGSSSDGGSPWSSWDAAGGVAVCTGQCLPGTSRWCDDPIYCNWGKQTCAPNGMWGACVEVPQAPAGCGGSQYDQGCCVAAGQCCQQFDYGPFGNPGGGASVGNCAGISQGCPLH